MPWPRGRGRGESKTSPRRIAAKLRAAEALKLWADGATNAAIARQLGYRDASGAWRAIDRALVSTSTVPDHSSGLIFNGANRLRFFQW
jgi:hypothetical protein